MSLVCSAALLAAPRLRLATTTVGPIFVVTGQNGATQSVDAANFGDGNLSLTATASVSWIAASITGAHACTFHGTCVGVQIALTTAALAKGKYTGVVTVSDPNAVDAPQTITVTVAIGGGIPDSLDIFLPPGGSGNTTFTSGRLTTTTTQPQSGPRFSVGASGGGSFDFAISYTVTATAAASVPEADYRGSMSVIGSTFAPDVKIVPVNLHVTTQPIASVSPVSLRFRLAQGAAASTQAVVLSNLGQGALAISGATASPTAAWLTSSVSGSAVLFTADPTGLSPGIFQTTVSIASNARNGPTTVAVELDVLATGPPVTFFQGVVDNSVFLAGAALAQGEIVALFGEQLIVGAPTQAAMLPLGTTLGGASVFVNNNPAPVYFVSGGQINFQIPFATPTGDAVVRVDRDGQRGNSVSVQILSTVPVLLRLGIADYGIVVLNDAVLTFPIPVTPGISSRPAKAGIDTVTIYALGLGQTTPPVTAGVAAPLDPLAQIPNVTVIFGEGVIPGTGAKTTPSFAGLTPGLVGLYQINVLVPSNSPRGNAVSVFIEVGPTPSNRVNIAVQ